MKKIVITIIAASTAFAVKSLLPLQAETIIPSPAGATEVVTSDTLMPISPVATAALPAVTKRMESQENVVAVTQAPLSFATLSKLNENIDEDQNSFQPYYIQSFILPGTGTYFTATNISADALTSGNATIGSLTIEDGATIEGSLSAGSLTAKKITAPIGITFHDRVTGEPYCLGVSGGAVQVEPAQCQ